MAMISENVERINEEGSPRTEIAFLLRVVNCNSAFESNMVPRDTPHAYRREL